MFLRKQRFLTTAVLLAGLMDRLHNQNQRGFFYLFLCFRLVLSQSETSQNKHVIHMAESSGKNLRKSNKVVGQSRATIQHHI